MQVGSGICGLEELDILWVLQTTMEDREGINDLEIQGLWDGHKRRKIEIKRNYFSYSSANQTQEQIKLNQRSRKMVVDLGLALRSDSTRVVTMQGGSICNVVYGEVSSKARK